MNAESTAGETSAERGKLIASNLDAPSVMPASSVELAARQQLFADYAEPTEGSLDPWTTLELLDLDI